MEWVVSMINRINQLMVRTRCFAGLHPRVISGRGMWGDAGTCLVCGADGYGLKGLHNTDLADASEDDRERLRVLDEQRTA